MIKEAKDILAYIILTRTPIVTANIARKAATERDLHHQRSFPFAALISADGGFDPQEARTARYADETAGTNKERVIRGTRTVPIEIRVWAADEDSGDAIAHDLIRHLPMRWDFDGLEGLVNIISESHTDNIANLTDEYVVSILVEFAIQVGADATDLPTFAGVTPGFDPPTFGGQ